MPRTYQIVAGAGALPCLMPMTSRRQVLAALLVLAAAPAVAAASGLDRGRWRKKLAKARRTQLARVKVYRDAGVFPKNADFKGERVPYFVDADGHPCAVAYLMQQAGHRDAVAAIAERTNHVRVMDVKDGPLVEWVLWSGLLQEEAALIQPSYDWREVKPVPRPRPRPRSPRPPGPTDAERERERIRQHLDAVVKQLEAATEESLTVALERAIGKA